MNMISISLANTWWWNPFSPNSPQQAIVCMCVLSGSLKLHDAHTLPTLGSPCWPEWVRVFFRLDQPCISLLHLADLLLFSSSQNCHELEKMDLEECILVRRRLASWLIPNMVLVVVLRLSCSNSWHWHFVWKMIYDQWIYDFFLKSNGL